MSVTRIKPETRKRAQELRREMTPPERILWRHLKLLKEQGIRFRRQAPIGPYIADFVSFSEKLIIELDGLSHINTQSYDRNRDRFLNEQGFRVLRFSNSMVCKDPADIVETVLNEVGYEQ